MKRTFGCLRVRKMLIKYQSVTSENPPLYRDGFNTPNAQGGLFETIEREPDYACLYERLRLDYRYGLDKYTQSKKKL